jgi:hypothetical protein
LLAHRTDRRRQIGLLLRRLFGGQTQKFPALLLNLNLYVPKVLITGHQKVPHVLFQRIGQARSRDRQRLRWLGVTHTVLNMRACRIHAFF